MKKFYSVLTLAFILSLVLNAPLYFYGQEQGGDNNVKNETTKSSSSFNPFWYFQGAIGPSFSHADLSDYGFLPDFKNVKLNGLVGFGRQFTSVIGVYGNLERGFFAGNKNSVATASVPNALYGRDMHFDNDYFGGNLNLGVNLSNWFGGYKEGRLVTVAIHAGVGQAQWKSRTFDSNTGELLRTMGFSDSPEANQGGGISDRKVALTVPVGADVNFHVSPKWDIYTDYSYTWMDTDNADGVVHGAMQIYNDVYSHFNIGVRFKFGAGANNIKKMAEDFDLVTLTEEPDPLEEIADSVIVTITATFPPKYFDKNAVMCFTPILEGQGKDFVLETIKFRGENVEGNGNLVSFEEGGTFTFSQKIPYDPAMYNSNLTVAPAIYKYDGTPYEDCINPALEEEVITCEPRKIADGVINTSDLIRHNEVVNFVPNGYKKVSYTTQMSDLFFQVNIAALNTNLPLNKDQNNIDSRNNTLINVAKGWELKDITINGWASPEGEETFNQNLSQKRAETGQKYIKTMADKLVKDKKLTKEQAASMNYVLTANGPDWNGFMKAVEKSDIKDKTAILNVVNAATASKKEEEIRNMILIYPELERDILPPLRRVNMAVTNQEPKRSDMQIAEYSISSPDSLSIEELLYAATLTDDLNTKKQIFANAMRMYPNDWRAVSNAAGVELALGNLDEAKTLLDRASSMNSNSFELQNNLATYYSKMGDFKSAETALIKARNLGADVDYNLGIIYINKGRYAEAVNLLSRFKCDFNLGLAQLMNNELSAAETTFNCMENKDAESFYLLAVTSARMDDKEKTLGYLSQSIKMDNGVKMRAQTDREFLSFYADPDFRALTGFTE